MQRKRILNNMEKYLSVLFPELERSFNISSASILNLLSKFPSAKAISSASCYDIKKAIDTNKARGRNLKMSVCEIRELASVSIGTSIKSIEKLLVFAIKELRFINEEIKEIENIMHDEIENNKDVEPIKEYINLLKTIPGVSDNIAMQFMSEIGDINRFNNAHKLIAYAGVDPVIYQSGKYEGRGRISKRGNKHLRRIIWIMATSVIMHNDEIREYFKERRKHMPAKKAIMKVVHKLLRIIFSMLSHKSAYVPHPERPPSTIFS